MLTQDKLTAVPYGHLTLLQAEHTPVQDYLMFEKLWENEITDYTQRRSRSTVNLSEPSLLADRPFQGEVGL